MSMLYRHFAPSNTSLSDDYDDEEPAQSNFFNGDQPLFLDAVVQPHWSSHSHSPPALRKVAVESPIASIPPEVLISVLKYLHQPRDLLNALRVSRTWCECAVELLWHKPAFTRQSTLDKMTKILRQRKQTFTYAKFIRRLNFLSLGPDLRDETFITFSRCDRLERLTLNGCKLLSTGILETALVQFPNLVAVDLTNVKETTNEVVTAFAVVAKRLQGINLQGCVKVGDPALLALAQNCPLLRRVKLSGLETATDEGVSAIVKGCPLLLEIDLNQCSLITDVSVRNIWLYSVHMRELRLSQCTNLTDLAFPAPPRLDLNGEPTNPFPQQDNADLPPLYINRTCEQLRMLDLTACALITDDAVEGIISRAPKIRNLVLSKCALLTDRSVEAICQLGRNLHYLHLGHACRITDRSVKTLARACNRIRYVDFANCTNLTDMSVFELSALPKLRRIGLVRVANLTDEAIYSLGERHATLERIHLSYCDQISVMAVHFLLLKLHKLTHLSLTGVPAFRQAELQRFCREAPKDFSSAQRQSFCVFSGKGISQLRSYLTELFDRITEQNGTDDTEYEEEDDDTETFQDTPEDERDLDDAFEPVHTPPPGHVAPTRGYNPRMYELALRAHRTAPTVFPTSEPVIRGSAANRMQADNAVQGATSALNQHLQQVRSGRPEQRSIADVLPIIEPLTTPNEAQLQAVQDFLTSGYGPFYGPPELTRASAPPPRFPHDSINAGDLPPPINPHFYRPTGTMTPDLNFAEIGHGRGTQGGSSTGATAGSTPSIQMRDTTPRQPFMEVDNPPLPPSSSGRSPNRSMSDPGSMSAFTMNPPIGGSTLPQDRGLAQQPPVVMRARERESRSSRQRREATAERRGHQLRSRIRNGLNTAEHYLFGRAPGGPPSTGEGGSGTPSNTGRQAHF
ncbi:hypothetical protein D9611_002635 [Ephemerocybe angulata]|uniref:F-box domain-containing protein n=1 Tax=Ephemerocybe angulata TaxID=980116 RepID=A0A8H5C1R2_9AGAR|nr:hypothetical protein D9611_002635 [Tulosesus angulatus]